MGYKGNSVQGEIPKSGAIFISNIKTKEECLKRKLFGLPSGMSDFVLHVKEGMTLFLFEFERRLLFGVYRATCDGDINIEPKAFRSSGKYFPAQVRFTTVWDCNPLAEKEFKDVIRDNYYSGKKFHFGLNEKQVSKLMKLFRSNIMSKSHPERNTKRYDDKPSDGNTRSRDLRTEIRHRLRFDSSDFRSDEVKEVDDDMYVSKHIIEDRQKDKREDFLTRYYTESDEFGDRGRHDMLGKHIEVREKHIEDDYMPVLGRHDMLGKHIEVREKHIENDYMPVFSKPHEIGVGSSDFLMDGGNKDIADYNRLHDEYRVRESYWGSLDDHPLTNHVLSPFNQNVYSNCDPIKINVPDIPHSPPCFDDGSSFIPIVNDCQFYPSPKKIHTSKSLSYYSHNAESIPYLDDPGSQSSIFPKFISRNLSSDNDPHVHEVDPPDNDKRFYEARENKHKLGSTDKRVSVFSRLSSTLRHKEENFETDEKHELNSSVDKVMKMLEKVASNPIKRMGKSSSVVKQDDDDNNMDSKIEDYGFPDVNLEVDAYEEVEVEGDSVFQETRLTDFKRRKKLNKRVDAASKESPGCLVGAIATSDVGSVETDQLTGTSRKRRKLVRPAFVEKNFISDGVTAREENTVSKNDSIFTKVVETSEKVDAFINTTDDAITVPISHENTPDGSNSSKAGIESLKKVDAFINTTDDAITVPISHENTPDGSNSSKAGIESLKKVDAFINTTDDAITVPISHENTPDGSNSSKAGIESLKKVDAFINTTDDAITVPISHENTPDGSNSSKAGSESLKKVDAFINTTDDAITVPISHENTPDGSNSSKAGIESLKKVDAFINTTDDAITVPISHENTPDGSNSSKAGIESLKKVDAFINTTDDAITVPISHENTPDDSNFVESSEKVNTLIKPIDLNMLPTSDESSSSKDDTDSTKASLESLHTAECKRKGNEGDGNTENRLMSGVFVEGTLVASPRDDKKMCGWIEW